MTADLTSREWADQLVRQHHEFFADNPSGTIGPVFFVEFSTGDIGVFPCLWRSTQEQRLALDAVRELIRITPEIVRYAFCGQVWTCRQDLAEPSPIAPDRHEQIITLVCDRRGPPPVTLLCDISRDDTGAVTSLSGPEAILSGAGGPLVELFDGGTRLQ